MGTASGMLTEARKWLGTSGRPNALTRAYAARNGSYYATAPWCDEAVTEWARRSGNHAAVCPKGDRAYTVWHAQDFQKAGRWYSGTTANINKVKPGDIIFFDWGATNSVGAIDHVGVVEKALGGGRVQTIEGNTGDACKRRVRGSGEIAGFGRPAYSSQQDQEDDMPEYVSVGMSKPQALPPGEWTTVSFDREASDSEHHHWDKGGPSVILGPCRYSLNASVRIEGLPAGTELQARVIERRDSDGEVTSNGPIAEFEGSGGDTFIHYVVAADTVGKGTRVRFQVIQYGKQPARIVSGGVKAFAWPTG